MNKKAWGLKSSKTITNREENTLQHSLVIPSVMMSVILQQEESILMLSWSTTSTWKQREQFTPRSKGNSSHWKQREQFTPGSKGNGSHLEAKGIVHTGSKGNSSHLDAKGTVHNLEGTCCDACLPTADHIRLQVEPRNRILSNRGFLGARSLPRYTLTFISLPNLSF